MTTWDEVEQRLVENENDEAEPIPLRRQLLGVLKRSGVTPTHATKKMIAFRLDRNVRVLWEIEKPASRFYLGAGWQSLLSKDGFETSPRPYRPGEKDGQRHSALSRDWSFGTADAVMTTVGLETDLERLLTEILGGEHGLMLQSEVIDRWIRKLQNVFPDFGGFDPACEEFDSLERDYKLETSRAMRQALDEPDSQAQIAGLVAALASSNLLNWRVTAPLMPSGNADRAVVGPALLAMAQAALGPAEAHPEALAHFAASWTSTVDGNQRDNARQIAEMFLMHLAPDVGIYIRATVRDNLWREATGERFTPSDDMAEVYRSELAFMQSVRDGFGSRGLAPRDFIDIQSALWVVQSYDISARAEGAEIPRPDQESHRMQPRNLILYGPPGTGKTHATAVEALRLCGEQVPEDRAEIMELYRRLCAEKRIDFVTFHQSMAYEDFIEGRQPKTGAEDGEEGAGPGFRLESVPGIFRQIAKRAETSRGRTDDTRRIRVDGRQVFKMSIGEASNPEDAYLFEEAIEGKYALLGFEDIDWTSDSYVDRQAMIQRLKDEGVQDGQVDARSGVCQMPFIFRNWVKPGDLVVVSKGNSYFRAIGEFTGGYAFQPREGGGYAHRRSVRWLWIDRTGAPVSEIYEKNFTQKSIYLLTDGDLKTAAFERYINSQQTADPGDPEPFVLIIDEINRANISKVFGELITLIEPDKRLGMENELKTRLPYSGDEFGVPANLHILGTMNTADRSIALLDTALRRRFEFREVMPEPAILKQAGERCGIDLPRLLSTINERIEYLYDREHQIGHAYFIGCRTQKDVDAVMRHKIIPLLSEYFFEDWSKVAAVLGDAEPNGSGGFLDCTILKPPPGLADEDDGTTRFRWTVRGEYEGFDYTGILGS